MGCQTTDCGWCGSALVALYTPTVSTGSLLITPLAKLEKKSVVASCDSPSSALLVAMNMVEGWVGCMAMPETKARGSPRSVPKFFHSAPSLVLTNKPPKAVPAKTVRLLPKP